MTLLAKHFMQHFKLKKQVKYHEHFMRFALCYKAKGPFRTSKLSIVKVKNHKEKREKKMMYYLLNSRSALVEAGTDCAGQLLKWN